MNASAQEAHERKLESEKTVHSPIGPLRHSGVDVLLQLTHFWSMRLCLWKIAKERSGRDVR